VSRPRDLAALHPGGVRQDDGGPRGAGGAGLGAGGRPVLPRHRPLVSTAEPGRARGDADRDGDGRALFDQVINAGGERYGIKLSAAETRRNIATGDVPLNHLVDREFWIGAVRMRGVRLCEPCKYLEELTQPRVMAALVHRGGLRAQILDEGIIRTGDVIRPA